MKRILVIEDDLFIRENVYEVLELSGYKVFSASNGKEGLALVSELIPDLIICDIMMPLMDGFEVKQCLSENSFTKNIPFVFLTAKTEIKELRLGMALGADDYITKPFEIKDLLNSIELRFNKLESIKKLYQVEPDLTEKDEPSNNRILLQNNGKTELVPYNEIVYIHSAGNYTEFFRIDAQKIIVRKNLKYWQNQLQGTTFLRVHKSFIINTYNLEKVEKLSNRSILLKMKFYSEPISASREHISSLKEYIK